MYSTTIFLSYAYSYACLYHRYMQKQSLIYSNQKEQIKVDV